MVTIPINSRFNYAQQGPLPEATQDEIKAEPMLFNCDGEHAMEMGGRLTRLFMSNLPNEWKNDSLIIDSRVHMLMPGWYPCIPGWHHDDVPREREDGQPEYFCPSYTAAHALCVWGDASLTQFAVGRSHFPNVPIGSVFYREWHPMVEQRIQDGVLHRYTLSERRIALFDWNTWHQGMPATKDGWRFFIRASRHTNRKATNERRQQTQIYMSAVLGGW